MKRSSPTMSTYHSPHTQTTIDPSNKSAFKLNPFRRIAKTARINLNRYWGLLSKITKQDSNEDIEVTFAAEMEQNRINEMLEAHARASSQNSMNSQWEEDFYHRGLVTTQWEHDIYGRGPLLSFHHETVTPSPQPMRRLIRTAKRSFYSSTSSAASHQLSSNYEHTSSQDSLFI